MTPFGDSELWRKALEPLPEVRGHGDWRDEAAGSAVPHGTGAPPLGTGAPPQGGNGADREPLTKLVPMTFLEDEVIPPRCWTVHDGWIPTRKLTLLQGNGGDGKTSLLQQLQSSCANVLPWLGLRVVECASLGIYSEDEEADLKERQSFIDAAYGLNCRKAGKMHLFPMADEDATLVSFDARRNPIITPFYRQVREAALDYHVGLITLDVAVDLFGGDEIKRREVRAFIRSLSALARAINAAVVLASHVSAAAIQSDGGHSGSTDWSNAVRSRLYLSRPKDDGESAGDPNARLLTRKKSNHASIGNSIRLHWQNGVIVPDTITTPSYFRRTAEDVFLELLDAVTREGQKVSAKPRAGNNAPAFFMKRPPRDREGFQRGDFELAMQRLLQRQTIKIVPYGPPSSGYEKLIRADADEEPS